MKYTFSALRAENSFRHVFESELGIVGTTSIVDFGTELPGTDAVWRELHKFHRGAYK
jgi:hypothetical protein